MTSRSQQLFKRSNELFSKTRQFRENGRQIRNDWRQIYSLKRIHREYNSFFQGGNWNGPFNPRPAGPLDFQPPAGGGCLNTPRLTRLLRIVEQYGKRRSKAR